MVRDSLAGVTIDFEDIPEDLRGPALSSSPRRLRVALNPLKRIVTAAVPSYTTTRELQRIAAVTDYVIAMLFDEHYGGGAPGPVASQQFYTDRARDIVAAVPREKVIFMVGAYGYDWHDDGSPPEAMTFQETMQAARDHHAPTHFDPVALNPYIAWTDPDSVDHVVWYLDGVTAYNELRVGRELGVAGAAIWRLGEEDASLWSVLGRRGLDGQPDGLRVVPPGYDVEFINDVVCAGGAGCRKGEKPDSGGDILRIRDWPSSGHRVVGIDAASGLIDRDSLTTYSTPYVVDRYGQREHEVALTFDDGPDGTWTPMILDTLRARHVPATFFVVGENVDTHILLTRRIYEEGHEIGSHTYSHPNLALVSDQRTRFELDANESLLESVLDHRTAFFRPPYFGDASPTTPDELQPVGIATRKGYYTVGLRDDSEDWQQISVDSIIKLTMSGRDTGNVVLLHDGGGDRAHTVAALGAIIDSLRARGDTLVLLSQLVGISRQDAMPPLAAVNEASRIARLAGWAALGVGELALYWIFMAAVVLGIGRLFLIAPLAILQRLIRHQRRGLPTRFTPPVTVIIPAFNEGKVILKTIASLVAQRYDGPIEIIVVDDGSADTTYQIVREAYADSRAVSVYRKENGGKASALNAGLARGRYEFIIALDADTIFAADTIAELVEPLADPRVGAVAGNAKVGNRVNLVTRWQALEYVTSQNLDRRAFSMLNGITVVPGAVGAWRKSLVEAAERVPQRHAGRRSGPHAQHPAGRTLDRVRRWRNRLHGSAGFLSRTHEAAIPLVVWHAPVHVEIPWDALSRAIWIARLGGSPQHLAVPVTAARHLATRRPAVRVQPVVDRADPISARDDVRAHQPRARVYLLRRLPARGLAGGHHRVPDGARGGQDAHVAHLPPAVRIPAGDVLGGGAVIQSRVPGTGCRLGPTRAKSDGAITGRVVTWRRRGLGTSAVHAAPSALPRRAPSAAHF